MKIIGFAGYSGAGKTTLLVKLIPLLKANGLSVATLKHAHHRFDVDKPGKDSFQHRQAGAQQVLVASSQRWALMTENGHQEPSLNFLLNQLSPVDLVLIEGFKTEPHPKFEVCRDARNGRLEGTTPNLVGLVTNAESELSTKLPTFDIDKPKSWINDIYNLAVNPNEVNWGS
ncbi:MAG: molybdopterin-guanine dinucleotide biosynthesis protein B [Alphaproteobacteria bacterium]